MLELAQSLILNEEVLQSLPENKRPVFIYEWLCFLNKVLSAAQKVIPQTSRVDQNEVSLADFRVIFENVNRKWSNN